MLIYRGIKKLMDTQLLFTGATGFVGKLVSEQVVRHGMAVKIAFCMFGEVSSCTEPFVVGEINGAAV
jgi:hypothetical protein